MCLHLVAHVDTTTREATCSHRGWSPGHVEVVAGVVRVRGVVVLQHVRLVVVLVVVRVVHPRPVP